jgi:CheY-like chemotaxis protein
MTERPATKPPSPQEANSNPPPAPIGGARADFVASLGKKANDARNVLGAALAARGTEEERAPREELRRRIHALNASAKMLHFDVMSKALVEAMAALDKTGPTEHATEDDLATVSHILDDLPALAWGDGPSKQAKRPSDPPAAEDGSLLRTALLVGSEMLAESLTDEDVVPGALPYDCERTDDAQAAISLARKVAPDVVVIDADVADTAELVEALLDDPFTEPVPIVVVGSFTNGAAASRFVALGVARTLTKPITPEDLRRACDDAVDQRNEVTMRVTLGEPTLEQLGERLADEVRKAIVQSVDAVGRGVRIPLGEGTEVMSAMWGAIARVREVVVARTAGAVRFASTGPEGAVAMAPWLQPDLPGTDRLLGSVGRKRGPAADVRLHGRRVIVADDDPGVTWFIADLLRTAGCVVSEALDGTAALDLAYRTSPELVISDILMPGLDGFALARALKRDVALRDVPVILLSWKEDLLQRVRELGAPAAAYLRKESDSRSILARVRECLRPRARVEARLRTAGEVRGRLDGLTVRSLLELACAIRPESRVAVRDASFLYEVEIRDGAPKRITRSQTDGTFERGERAFTAVLGVGSGRFTVCSSAGTLRAEEHDLSGTLAEQLARPVATARASRIVTTGARTSGIERVKLDANAIPILMDATPEPARSIVQALADGKAPRAMLLGGEVDPMLLDDVLSDLASRGAVEAVWGQDGEEVMAKEVEALLAPRAPTVREAPVLFTPPPPPAAAREKAPSGADAGPSSLEDAVMRELTENVPKDRPSSARPPIVQPGELRPRTPMAPAPFMVGMTPIPPDAVVPASDENDLTEIDAPIGPAAAKHVEPSIPIEVGSMVSAPVAMNDVTEPPARTPMASVASSADQGVGPSRMRKPRWPWGVAITLVAIAVLFGLQSAGTADAPPASAGAARVTDPVVAAPLPKRAPIAPATAASSDAGHVRPDTATP